MIFGHVNKRFIFCWLVINILCILSAGNNSYVAVLNVCVREECVCAENKRVKHIDRIFTESRERKKMLESVFAFVILVVAVAAQWRPHFD